MLQASAAVSDQNMVDASATDEVYDEQQALVDIQNKQVSGSTKPPRGSVASSYVRPLRGSAAGTEPLASLDPSGAAQLGPVFDRLRSAGSDSRLTVTEQSSVRTEK